MYQDPFVKWMQGRLNLLTSARLTEDGVFGRLTQKALKGFQSAQGLKVTGVADSATVGALKLTNVSQGVSGDRQNTPSQEPPWFSLGLTKMGLNEVRDKKELEAFLRSDGNTLGDPSKLPWCGDFVETCIAVTLPQEPMIVNPYWALNWLKFGRSVPTSQVYRGAIAAFERSGGGHVGFVAGFDATYLHILGGNQSNSISIARVARDRLRGFRWPNSYPYPSPEDELKQVSFDTTIQITTNEA